MRPRWPRPIDVPREVVDQPQNDGEQRAAEPARLDAPEGRVLIGDVVILERGQLQDLIDLRPMDDLRLALLVMPQHPQERRSRQEQPARSAAETG